MASESDKAILKACEEAILEIVSGRGSSWSIAGRQFTTLNLDELRAMEKEYRRRVQAPRRQFIQPGGFHA